MDTTLLAPQRPSTDSSSLLLDTGSLHLEGRTARTGLADRIAMRVALGLLLWSTRPDHDEHTLTRDLARATADRERAWERARHLIHPTL